MQNPHFFTVAAFNGTPSPRLTDGAPRITKSRRLGDDTGPRVLSGPWKVPLSLPPGSLDDLAREIKALDAAGALTNA